MISNADMELYIKLLDKYTACPVHPVQAKTIGENPLDFEPEMPHPFPGVTPKEIPDVPPDDDDEEEEEDD